MSSFPEIDPADRRLNLFDLDGNRIETNGTPARIQLAFIELRPKPDWDSALDTQLMFGEAVSVYQSSGQWSLVKANRDGYVGWLETKSLDYEVPEPTHLVCAPRTFFYPEADLKKPHMGMRSMGCALTIVGTVEKNGTTYAITDKGLAIFKKHIRPIGDHENDYVSVAERLISTPYLWGGATAFGIDCSGFVKLAMFMTGKNVLRDSDMQAASIGTPFVAEPDLDNIKRGDLVFWKGHVGICQGANHDGQHMLIHANANSMDVCSEPLSAAIERIAYLYGQPIGFRRV